MILIDPIETYDYPQSPAEIAAHINEGLDELGPEVFPIALRQLAAKYGGVKAVAARAGVSADELFATLKTFGDPKLSTVVAVLETFGLRLRLEPGP